MAPSGHLHRSSGRGVVAPIPFPPLVPVRRHTHARPAALHCSPSRPPVPSAACLCTQRATFYHGCVPYPTRDCARLPAMTTARCRQCRPDAPRAAHVHHGFLHVLCEALLHPHVSFVSSRLCGAVSVLRFFHRRAYHRQCGITSRTPRTGRVRKLWGMQVPQRVCVRVHPLLQGLLLGQGQHSVLPWTGQGPRLVHKYAVYKRSVLV